MSPLRDKWIIENDPTVRRNVGGFGSPDRLTCYWAGPAAERCMLEDLAAELPGQHWPVFTRDDQPDPWSFPRAADLVVGHGLWMKWLDKYRDLLPSCPRVNIVFCDCDYFKGYRYDRRQPAQELWDYAAGWVSGVVTNSRRLALDLMKQGVPARFTLHAAPARFFDADAVDEYRCDVCWAGSIWTDGSYHKHWRKVLLPAAEACRDARAAMNIYGLKYRSGSKEALCENGARYRGWIPFGDLPAAYASARIVLGLTQDTQQEWGMVNNRVYEALAAGKPLVCDWFQALDDEGLSKFVVPVRSEAEAYEAVMDMLSTPASYDAALERAREGREWVREHATYGHIARAVLDVAWEATCAA